MAFSTRRGRPRKTRIEHDTGTPELNYKRLFAVTAEPLDLCLERGLISERQHWCGIHFRWLYTLRYGAPGVRAVDTAHPGGYELHNDDPEWRSAREEEFNEAAGMLAEAGYLRLILSLCVFNDRPGWLHAPSFPLARAATGGKESGNLSAGLDLLRRLWKKSR